MSAADKAATVGASLSYAYDLRGFAKTRKSKKEPVQRALTVGGGVTDVYCLTNCGLYFDPRIAVNATKALGIVGAVLTLAYDGATMASRVKAYSDIVKQQDEAPDEAGFKKMFLEEQRKYTKKLLKSSFVGVSVDSLEVAASVVPVLSLPANLTAFIVSMGRIYAENKAGKSLQKSLKGMTAKHEEDNEEIIHAKDVFKEQHLQLKTKYEQAQATKQETAKALEKATKRMRQLPHKKNIEAQQKATEKDVEAEQALKEIGAEFQASTIAMTNLEAYEQAVKLIIELDPLLKLEFHLRNVIEKCEKTYPEILEKDGVEKLTATLKKQSGIATKDLARYRMAHHQTPLLPHLHHSEHTVKMEEQIDLLRAQLQDLAAYTESCKDLAKLEKQKKKVESQKHKKLAKKELSVEHFEMNTPTSPRTPASKPSHVTHFHTSRTLPSLPRMTTTFHVSKTTEISPPSSSLSTETSPPSSSPLPFSPPSSSPMTRSLSASSV
jgi:hypothetical protein